MPAKKAKDTKMEKPAKTSKTVKPVAKAKSTKAAKSAKAAKPPKTEQAILDEREANRLRQQRFLSKHRDEINEKRRERYAARKENSCCPRCGKKLRSVKFALCKNCLEKARDYNQR